jgi:hypothetical protein
MAMAVARLNPTNSSSIPPRMRQDVRIVESEIMDDHLHQLVEVVVVVVVKDADMDDDTFDHHDQNASNEK